jgi:O-antigen/teichoic acid export membrane protein
MVTMLVRNVLAQSYSQLVTLLAQIVTVPILINAWGIDTFGVWVLLSAIPAYFSFSDFGFTFIAKNDMSMRVAAGDRVDALKTYQSVFVLLSFVSVSIFALSCLLVLELPLNRIFNLATVEEYQAEAVLLLQIGSVLLYQLFLLLCAGVRSEGRADLDMAFAATSRLIEMVAVVSAAQLGFGLVGAALAGLGSRALSTVLIFLWLRRKHNWVAFGIRHASFRRIKALVNPSFSYMLVPVSNALILHGPVAILGSVASPAIVALYAVTRTVCRLGMAVANLINFAFAPEYSYALGRLDVAKFKLRFNQQMMVLLAAIALYGIVIALFGRWAIAFLAGGHVASVQLLSVALTASVALEMYWTGIYSPLVALNRHQRLSILFFVLAVSSLSLASWYSTAIVFATSSAVLNLLMAVILTVVAVRQLNVRLTFKRL